MKMPLGLLLIMLAISFPVYGFSFSEGEEKEKAEAALKAERVQALFSAPCLEKVKNKKIMVVIGEQNSDGRILTKQSNYGLLVSAINRRLREAGLKTYTQKEIDEQIKQAEIEAYFQHNDPDAASSAAQRLRANLILDGLITSHSSINRLINVNEVHVKIKLTLSSATGQTISHVNAHAESYAGADTLGVTLEIVEEQGDEVVGKIYSDYCRTVSR